MIKFYFKLLCYYTSNISLTCLWLSMVKMEMITQLEKKLGQFFHLFNSCVVEKLPKTNNALCTLDKNHLIALF